MKKQILLSFFSLFAYTSIAQTGSHTKDWAQLEVIQKANKVIGEDIYSNVNGSIYHLDSYLEGKLLFEGKQLDRNILYRYEAYSDVIEVKLENGEEDILAQSPKLDILIGDELYSYILFYNKTKREMDFGYMTVIDKNEKYDLYNRKIKKLRPGKKAQTTMTADLEPKLLMDKTIYFRLSGDKFAKSFPERKSDLYKMFPNQKSELKKLLRSEKVDLTNPRDVERIMEICL